jgi:hypothetical protein
MKKILPKNVGTLKYSLIAIIILLIPIGYYLLYHVPSQKDFFTSRNLRLLGDMSKHISGKIESYKQTIDNGLIKNNKIRLFYKKFPLNEGVYSDSIRTEVKERIQKIQNLQYKDSKFFPGKAVSEIRYNLELNGSRFDLYIDYRGQRIKEDDSLGTLGIHLTAHASLDSIISPLTNPEIFDNILLVEYEGQRVVYQANQEEFLAIRLDSISANVKETRTSHYGDVVWGNTHYKLYVQPVRISALSDAAQMNGKGGLQWMLIGLVEANRFNADSRAISYFKISLFLFLVLLVLFSMPLFKLHFIGEREELKRVDLLLALFSLFVGAGIITFFLLSVYSDTKDKYILDDSLEILAEEIEQNVNAEIDSLLQQYEDVRQDIQNRITEPTVGYIFGGSGRYPYFTQIAWIDNSGMQVLKIRRDSPTPLVNVNSRPYFRKIKVGEFWYRGQDNSRQPYYIQPIISITTGENSAVLSVPDTISLKIRYEKTIRTVRSKVAAISVHFISLLNPVLTEGSGFCIINENGEVLFHNEQNRNLQENFFTECDENPRLRAAVYSRVEKNLKVNYLGREHRAYLRPLRNTPWTLITFADLKLVRSSELNALTSGTILFAFLVLLSFVVLFTLYFLKLLKNFDWLWPQHALNDTYRILIIVLLTLSGFYYYTIFNIFNISPNTNLHVALFLPFVITLATYLMLQRKILWRELPTTTKRAILGVLVLAGVILYLAGQYFFVYGISGFIIGCVLSSNFITNLTNREKFPEYYTRFAMSGVALLFLTSILPSIAFFKVAYDSEFESFIKRGQLSLLRGIENRKDRLNKLYKDPGLNPDNPAGKKQSMTLISERTDFKNAWDIHNKFFFKTTIIDSADFDSVFRSNYEELISEHRLENTPFKPAGVSPLDSLLALLRSNLRIVNPKSWELYHSGTADRLWEWQKLDDMLMLLKRIAPESEHRPYIVSRLNNFHSPSFWVSAVGLFFLVLLLLIVMIYFIKKVFMIDVILPSKPRYGKLGQDTILQNVIYIGQPNSGKSEYVNQIKNKKIINLRQEEDPDVLLTKYEKIEDDPKVYVVDHFELYLDNPKWNYTKLVLLEHLVSLYKKTVVIVSTIDPLKFLSRIAKPPRTEEEKQLLQEQDLHDRWVMILSSFTKKYHSIDVDSSFFVNFVNKKCQERIDHLLNGQDTKKLKSLCETIISECQHIAFLQRIGMEIVENLGGNEFSYSRDLLIDEILQKAETYYRSIWSVCSTDEKITLYHLARNGFITPKETETVRMLMRKGLIRKEPRFILLNESFKKFVLTAESAAVIEQWKRSQPRSWGNIRTPLVTVLIAVALFIFVTQRETFNESVAWISAFVASIPALLKLLNLFRPGGIKTPDAS